MLRTRLRIARCFWFALSHHAVRSRASLRGSNSVTLHIHLILLFLGQDCFVRFDSYDLTTHQRQRPNCDTFYASSPAINCRPPADPPAMLPRLPSWGSSSGEYVPMTRDGKPPVSYSTPFPHLADPSPRYIQPNPSYSGCSHQSSSLPSAYSSARTTPHSSPCTPVDLPSSPRTFPSRSRPHPLPSSRPWTPSLHRQNQYPTSCTTSTA